MKQIIIKATYRNYFRNHLIQVYIRFIQDHSVIRLSFGVDYTFKSNFENFILLILNGPQVSFFVIFQNSAVIFFNLLLNRSCCTSMLLIPFNSALNQLAISTFTISLLKHEYCERPLPSESLVFYKFNSLFCQVLFFFRTGSQIAIEGERVLCSTRSIHRNTITSSVVRDELIPQRQRSFTRSSHWRGIHSVCAISIVILTLSVCHSCENYSSENKSVHISQNAERPSSRTSSVSKCCAHCIQSRINASLYAASSVFSSAYPDSVSLRPESFDAERAAPSVLDTCAEHLFPEGRSRDAAGYHRGVAQRARSSRASDSSRNGETTSRSAQQRALRTFLHSRSRSLALVASPSRWWHASVHPSVPGASPITGAENICKSCMDTADSVQSWQRR